MSIYLIKNGRYQKYEGNKEIFYKQAFKNEGYLCIRYIECLEYPLEFSDGTPAYLAISQFPEADGEMDYVFTDPKGERLMYAEVKKNEIKNCINQVRERPKRYENVSISILLDRCKETEKIYSEIHEIMPERFNVINKAIEQWQQNENKQIKDLYPTGDIIMKSLVFIRDFQKLRNHEEELKESIKEFNVSVDMILTCCLFKQDGSIEDAIEIIRYMDATDISRNQDRIKTITENQACNLKEIKRIFIDDCFEFVPRKTGIKSVTYSYNNNTSKVIFIIDEQRENIRLYDIIWNDLYWTGSKKNIPRQICNLLRRTYDDFNPNLEVFNMKMTRNNMIVMKRIRQFLTSK